VNSPGDGDSPAQKLRRYREQTGLSLEEFGRRLHRTKQHMHAFETGDRNVPPDLLEQAEQVVRLQARASARASEQAPDSGEVHPLVDLLRLLNCSQGQLIRKIARVNGGRAPARQTLWRWMNWDTVPELDYQLALAEIAHVDPKDVETSPWPAWLPGPHNRRIEVSDHDVAGIIRALDTAAGETHVNRRTFLTISTAVIDALAGQWAGFTPSGEAADPHEGTSQDLVSSIENRLPLIRLHEDLHGGGSSLGLINAELVQARELLRQPLGATAENRLLRAIAELARLAGWASVDVQAIGSAESYFIAALKAARRAADPIAGANAIKCMALLLIEANRAAEADVLLASARHATRGASPRVQAMVAARQGRARAALGDHAGSRAHLAEAADLLDEAESAGDAGPTQASCFKLPELAAQSAAAYQLLDRHADTVALLETAVRNQPDRPRDRATYMLWLSRSAVALNDLDKAGMVLTSTIPEVLAGSSARNRVLLTSVYRQILPHRTHPAIRPVDEMLRDLIH
jgi:transcriptional regulator with XRE-family HTH domain